MKIFKHKIDKDRAKVHKEEKNYQSKDSNNEDSDSKEQKDNNNLLMIKDKFIDKKYLIWDKSKNSDNKY